MRIAFRVDASLQIGSGHVMRCLTLADKLKEHGAEVLFLCREHQGHLCELIEGRGGTVRRLPKTDVSVKLDWNRHAQWLQASLDQDARQTLDLLEREPPLDWMIVDHYALDISWEKRMRPVARQLMVIDDLADRKHDCDLLLDQNFYKDEHLRYKGLLPDSCTQLLGPKYALLRSEFAQSRKSPRKRQGAVRHLFVFVGGSDIDNVTGQILEAVLRLERSDLSVDVVVGGTNPHRQAIQELCNQHSNMTCHCQVHNIAELMVAADLAVAAGGSTTWERCCLGLPSLVVSMAANQAEMCMYGAEKGLFHYLGSSGQLSVADYCSALSTFTLSSENLKAFSTKGLNLVDGRGVDRVCSMMMPPQIVVRPAVEEDCDAVHAWRNAEETRRYIFDSNPVPLDTHRVWFANTLSNPDRILLIGQLGGQPVGVLRFDIEADHATISVYLVPGISGQGIGMHLIQAGCHWLAERRPGIHVVDAEILSQNVASINVFERAGFKLHHLTYQKELL